MRWTPRPLPKDGEERERVVFAWWPMGCDNGETVWLGRVWVRERYFVPAGLLSIADAYLIGWFVKERLPLAVRRAAP